MNEVGVQFLARCLQSEGALSQSDLAALVADSPADGGIWTLAEEHGVEFLLIQRLRDSGGLEAFEGAAAREIPYRENLLNNLQLVACYHQMLECAEEQGLRMFCFKGPVLAAAEYGNLFVRGAGDIDLLVAREDVDKACDVLNETGFSAIETLRGRRYREFHFHLPFANESGVEVELHWSVTREYCRVAFDFSELWRRRHMFRLQGREMAILSPEDHFLILCVHGTRHLWERLIWICDLRAVVERHEDFDWDFVRAESKRKGCYRMALLGSFLMCRILGVALPAWALVEVYRDPAVLRAARKVLRSFSIADRAELGALQRDLFCYRLRERWVDKLRFFWALPWREYLDMWEDGLNVASSRSTGMGNLTDALKVAVLWLRRSFLPLSQSPLKPDERGLEPASKREK